MKTLVLVLLLTIVISGCANSKIKSSCTNNYTTLDFGPIRIAYDISDNKAGKIVKVISEVVRLVK